MKPIKIMDQIYHGFYQRVVGMTLNLKMKYQEERWKYTQIEKGQLYTTNFPENKKLYNGDLVRKNDGVCFETQNLPIEENYKFIENSLIKKMMDIRLLLYLSFIGSEFLIYKYHINNYEIC